MSLSEKLAQAAAARARREASEADAARAEHDQAVAESSYALRFEDVTIDLTREVAAVRHGDDGPAADAPAGDPDDARSASDAPTVTDPTAAAAEPPRAARPITIDELKRRRAARFAMRPAPPSPFDTPALPPIAPPAPAPAPPMAAALDDAQRQALLERLSGLRVERYLTEDDNSGPAALTVVPSGERVTELLRRRPTTRGSVATEDDADDTTATDVAPADATPAAETATEAPPVVIDTPFVGDPFAGLRPNTTHLPQPRPGRLRLRRSRDREPQAASAPAAPIPGPRCASCGGPARIDIVDRASQRRHLSCVCCGRLWEERLDG